MPARPSTSRCTADSVLPLAVAFDGTMTVERSADASAPATSAVIDPPADAARAPYLACAVVGLGGLFAGVTGPLLSTFVPPLVRDALGDHRTAIGLVMAIDNVLLLLLVPWSGAASDRASAQWSRPAADRDRRLRAVGGRHGALPGVGSPWASSGLIGAIVVLYTGINVQRSPFQALVADLVPSRYRSLATGSVTFQMCVGAIVFLMLGRMLGHAARVPGRRGDRAGDRRRALPSGCGSRRRRRRRPPRPRFGSLLDVAWSAARGLMPGIRAIFVASLLLQLTFQTFTTWFALHGTERFGVRPEDVTIGFIAWAIGGVIGALPAGMIGVRIGRRNAMLLGFALMTACLVALDRVTAVSQAMPLLALASASWTLPTVNAYPLFVEPIPRAAAWRGRGLVPPVHGAGRRDWRSVQRRVLRSRRQLSTALSAHGGLHRPGLRRRPLRSPRRR